jgi:LCP family protein required for cell wall assembly
VDDRELLGEPRRQGTRRRIAKRHNGSHRGVGIVRRRAIFVVMALTTWVTGSALGAMSGSVVATAQGSGIVVGKAHAGFTPSLSGSKPIVLLMVGSGARPGDDVSHSLADSLHLVFINPAKHRATLVGIPRDSYVPIPNHGTGKINSSLFYGGPALLVDTIENMSGVTIDYWAITTFWGFEDMINGVGGVTMNVPFAMSDPYARADFQPGVQELTGKEALAFARTRHDLQQGDFGRQENGGRLFLASLAQFQKEYKADPSRLFVWLGSGMRNVDTTAPLAEVIQLAFTASHIPVKNVQNVVLPGSAGMSGSLSVVFLDAGRKTAIFNDVKVDAILLKKNVPPSPTAGD